MNRIKVMKQIDKAIENKELNVDTINLHSLLNLVFNYNDSLSHLYYDNMDYFDDYLGGMAPSKVLQMVEFGNASFYDDYFKITNDDVLETITSIEYDELLQDNIVEILFSVIADDDVWNDLVDDVSWYMDEKDLKILANIKNSIDK